MLLKNSDMDTNYPYIDSMNIKNVIADNIRRLTKARKITIAKLGELSGSSYGNAHRTINPIEDGYNPTTKSLQAISDGLKIPFWTMAVPDMPVELFDDPDLEHLIKTYAKCKPENRAKIIQHINDVARLDDMDRANEI